MASDGEDYTDRPARRDAPGPEHDYGPPESYDYEGGPNPFRRLGYLDRQFGQSSLVMLILFPVVAGVVAFAFAFAGVVACRDPRARRNAWIVLALSLVPAAAFVALVVHGGR